MPTWQKMLFASTVIPASSIPGFLVVGSVTTPFLTVYDSGLNKITKTWTTPVGSVQCVAISPDKRWIATGNGTGPASSQFLEIYDCITGVPVRVTGLTFTGFTTLRSVAFTADSTKLMVLDVTTPFLYCFDVGGSWPATAGWTRPTFANTPVFLDIHPEGTKYALGYSATPFVNEYNLMAGTVTGTFSGSALVRAMSYNTVDSATDYIFWEETGPTYHFHNAVTGAGLTCPSPIAGNATQKQHGARLNSDGTKLIIPGSGPGNFQGTEYQLLLRSGTTVTNATLGTAPSDAVIEGIWSLDGTKLITINNGAIGPKMYSYNAVTRVKDADNANMPPGAGTCLAISW